MQKSPFRFIVAFIVAFATSSSYAGWRHYVNPVELIFEGAESGDRAYVHFSTNFSEAGCRHNGHYVRLYANTKKGEHMLTTILMAIASKKQIYPLITGCDDWSRPVLAGLRIK